MISFSVMCPFKSILLPIIKSGIPHNSLLSNSYCNSYFATFTLSLSAVSNTNNIASVPIAY